MIGFDLRTNTRVLYELFLEPDSPLDDEDARAFYDYFLGRVVEAPVTCFSRRPDSIVMWAHYGREGAGICLGFDEETLVDQFPIVYVGDVEYADKPARHVTNALTKRSNAPVKMQVFHGYS